MLEIKLYLSHKEIKDCYENGADAEIATITDCMDNIMEYCVAMSKRTEKQ